MYHTAVEIHNHLSETEAMSDVADKLVAIYRAVKENIETPGN